MCDSNEGRFLRSLCYDVLQGCYVKVPIFIFRYDFNPHPVPLDCLGTHAGTPHAKRCQSRGYMHLCAVNAELAIYLFAGSGNGHICETCTDIPMIASGDLR